MNPAELKQRTMQFAVRILKFADALPNNPSGRTIANQVARSGTSVAANYRAALRAKSRADFINKITIVLEEADEVTGPWRLAADVSPLGVNLASPQEFFRLRKR